MNRSTSVIDLRRGMPLEGARHALHRSQSSPALGSVKAGGDTSQRPVGKGEVLYRASSATSLPGETGPKSLPRPTAAQRRKQYADSKLNPVGRRVDLQKQAPVKPGNDPGLNRPRIDQGRRHPGWERLHADIHSCITFASRTDESGVRVPHYFELTQKHLDEPPSRLLRWTVREKAQQAGMLEQFGQTRSSKWNSRQEAELRLLLPHLDHGAELTLWKSIPPDFALQELHKLQRNKVDVSEGKLNLKNLSGGITAFLKNQPGAGSTGMTRFLTGYELPHALGDERKLKVGGDAGKVLQLGTRAIGPGQSSRRVGQALTRNAERRKAREALKTIVAKVEEEVGKTAQAELRAAIKGVHDLLDAHVDKGAIQTSFKDIPFDDAHKALTALAVAIDGHLSPEAPKEIDQVPLPGDVPPTSEARREEAGPVPPTNEGGAPKRPDTPAPMKRPTATDTPTPDAFSPPNSMPVDGAGVIQGNRNFQSISIEAAIAKAREQAQLEVVPTDFVPLPVENADAEKIATSAVTATAVGTAGVVSQDGGPPPPTDVPPPAAKFTAIDPTASFSVRAPAQATKELDTIGAELDAILAAARAAPPRPDSRSAPSSRGSIDAAGLAAAYAAAGSRGRLGVSEVDDGTGFRVNRKNGEVLFLKVKEDGKGLVKKLNRLRRNQTQEAKRAFAALAEHVENSGEMVPKLAKEKIDAMNAWAQDAKSKGGKIPQMLRDYANDLLKLDAHSKAEQIKEERVERTSERLKQSHDAHSDVEALIAGSGLTRTNGALQFFYKVFLERYIDKRVGNNPSSADPTQPSIALEDELADRMVSLSKAGVELQQSLKSIDAPKLYKSIEPWMRERRADDGAFQNSQTALQSLVNLAVDAPMQFLMGMLNDFIAGSAPTQSDAKFQEAAIGVRETIAARIGKLEEATTLFADKEFQNKFPEDVRPILAKAGDAMQKVAEAMLDPEGPFAATYLLADAAVAAPSEVRSRILAATAPPPHEVTPAPTGVLPSAMPPPPTDVPPPLHAMPPPPTDVPPPLHAMPPPPADVPPPAMPPQGETTLPRVPLGVIRKELMQPLSGPTQQAALKLLPAE